MCGIAAIINLDGSPADVRILGAMCAALAHRGPDGQGRHVDGPIGLGHRRLAIIDLTPAGDQPQFNEDHSIALVLNGEIYNYQDIRRELTLLGHHFNSQGDSEVVVHAYEEWGTNCVDHLNGMFALVIWDSRRRRLFVARDRYGIKPLYYAITGQTILLSSEIKGLLQHPAMTARVDENTLAVYFTFQNVFSPRTLFKGVHLFPAGHCWEGRFGGDPLRLEEDGLGKDGELRTQSFWDFDFSTPFSIGDISWEECAGKLRELFEAAVNRQLISDVPVGAFLSGGMDSGSIVAVASRAIPRLMTFTGGFDLTAVTGAEASFDEREAAELMASCFGTEHYEMVMHAGDMAWVMQRLIWHLEDLRMGMCYHDYYISRLAGRFVKVVLSGAGGDELFAGYPWRYAPILEVADTAEYDRISFHYWQRLIPETDHRDFYTSRFREIAEQVDLFAEMTRVFPSAHAFRPGEALTRALYFEARTFLHGLLILGDKIGMAHGLEIRLPFLDNDLVDFAQKIPPVYKLKPTDPIFSLDENQPGKKEFHYRRSKAGKHILRRAMEGLIPREILEREKQGFSPPEGSWYRGPTMAYLTEMLLAPRTLERGFFQPEYIRRILREHTGGARNHRLLLWSLLSFEWWCRVFLDGETPLTIC